MAKQYPCDGFTRKITVEDLKPGNVIRMMNTAGSQSPFSDCVITGIVRNVVQLARPMLWAKQDGDGTYETHVETFAPFDTSLIGSEGWALVLLASGAPYTMQTFRGQEPIT